MTVTGVRLADPTQTTTKAGYANYSRKAQEEPTQTTGVNFEGRKDADTFEKKESHTVRNAVVGTAVGVAALATVAAFLGKYGIKIKDPQNLFTKGINTVIDKCHIGAAVIKKYAYTKPLEFIKGLFNRGGNPPTGA